MHFDLTGFMMNPFTLMFITVISGVLFGKVKFGRFNFGISGTLFTGLAIGWFAYHWGEKILALGEDANGYSAAAKMMGDGIISNSFFDLFLVIFLAAVGLLASKDIKTVIKKDGAFFVILGVLTTSTAAITTYSITLATTSGDSKASPYEVTGVYTGALTSSPGLAAALETAGKEAEKIVYEYESASMEEKQEILDIVSPDKKLNPADYPTLTPEQVKAYRNYAVAGVGIGHAISYPFGVLLVILGVNFFPRIFRINMDKEWARYEADMTDARESAKRREIPEVPFNVLTFVLTCLIGSIVGKIEFPLGSLGDFSLGSSGGTLIMALVLGYIGKIGPINFRMDAKILGTLRQFSLAFFLAIVGLKYGNGVVDSLSQSGVLLAVAGIVVCVAAMLACFLVGRYAFKLNWILLSGTICGCLTSTPGLGASIDACRSDKPAVGYGAAYPFALMSKVILVIILHKLPM